MDELTIDDLSFENAAGETEVFNAFAAPKEDLKPGNTTPEVPKIPEISKVDEKTPTASEEIKSPESVAAENINQGQAGEASKEAGASSSSPELNDSETLFSNLATHFVSKGVLPDLDPKEIKSLEDIEAAIQKTIDKGLTDKQAAIAEAIKAGAPADAVAAQVETIGRLKGITPEMINSEGNTELRLNLIAQDFQNKGYEASRALVLAQRSLDAGTGNEDAKYALDSIIQTEEARKQSIIQGAIDKEAKSLKDIKDYMGNTKEIVPGIALTSVQNEEVFRQMTTNIGEDQSAFTKFQRENPVSSRIQLETVFYLTKGLTDFSIFGQKASTTAAKSIEDTLRGMSFTEDGRVQTEVKDNNSNFSLADFKNFEVE